MVRQRALLWTIVIMGLTALACNAFAGPVEPALQPPDATAERQPNNDTAAPAPTVTLPAASDANSPTTGASVTVLVDLNVRSGPGVEYDRIGFLLEGESAPILGSNAAGSWWQIVCPANVDNPACWVSAGEQYSRATDTDAVPVVEAPPTPTPRPPDLPENSGVLAYINNGRLFATTLDLSSDPPTADAPRQLSDLPNVQQIALAPDGRRVAFIAGTYPDNHLHVINIDGQGQKTLVTSADLAREGDAEQGVAVLLDQMAWQPNGRGLAFTTALINLVGPGAGSQQDLWLVDLDGNREELLPPGAGGGQLAFVSDGSLLVSGSEQIARVDLADGTAVATIRFPLINTASEYIYFPPVQITAGDTGYVAVPDADPWQPGSGATLWRIPPDGPAFEIGTLPGNILFAPVQWRADGTQLGYVRQLMDADNPAPELVIANGNGQDAAVVSDAAQIRFFGWNPAGDALLYAAQGVLAVQQANAAPLQFALAQGQIVSDGQWLTDGGFVTAVGFPNDNTWELRSGSTGGSLLPLATLASGTADVVFDVWTGGE